MTLDEQLFGDLFAAPSWDAWRACTAAMFGEPMTAAEQQVYEACTGRRKPPAAPVRKFVGIMGRRSGKSRRAAAWAVRIATRDYSTILAPGEVGTLPVIAADRAQARNVFGYITGLIDSVPFLSRLVVSRTNESIELATRCRIEVHTASFRSVRGYTIVGAVGDELAFWRGEDSANPDKEIVAALLPAMATVPEAPLILISSPYSRRGVLWDEYQAHWGKDDSTTIIWCAPTLTMNPTVPASVIDQAMAEDEPAARAEYFAEFRRDLEQFVSREVIEAATVPGRVVLPPVSKVRYCGFVDPSGGASDSFTVAVGHGDRRDGTTIAVLDLVAERRPPFSPDAIVAEYAQVLKSYGIKKVQADKYAGQWVVEAFGKCGIVCEQSAEPKSTLYGTLLPLLNSGRVELLEHPRLAAQLLSLERRTARAGRDSIDHPPNQHDDLANAVAGVLALAAEGPSTGVPQATGLAPRAYRPVDWGNLSYRSPAVEPLTPRGLSAKDREELANDGWSEADITSLHRDLGGR